MFRRITITPISGEGLMVMRVQDNQRLAGGEHLKMTKGQTRGTRGVWERRGEMRGGREGRQTGTGSDYSRVYV